MIKLFKYLILIIALLFCYQGDLVAANYYFDLASGNDTTGNGSAGNPWKTIDKCTTSRSAGDECRGAKTTITTLTGTLTFTNNSTTVNTSADLSAVVAAGDIVGKNSGLEGWWKVASRNSTTITLDTAYWGLSGSGDAVTGYKITPVAASEEYDVNSSGSAGSPILISGGWDLTGPTQNGITCFSTTYTYGIDFNTKNYVTAEKFIIVTTSTSGFDVDQSDQSILNTWVLGGTAANIQVGSSATNFYASDVVLCGGAGSGISLSGSLATIENAYAFSVGTGSGDSGFSIGSSGNTLKNARSYNPYATGFSFSGEAFGNFLASPISETVRSGANISVAAGSGANYIYGLSASGASTYVFNLSDTGTTCIECSYTNGSSGELVLGTAYQAALVPSIVIKKVGEDSRMVWQDGEVIHDSTAACRSGKCVKFDPSSATYPLMYKVGTVKIPSAATDLTINAYLKDDSDFNGAVFFFVSRNGEHISRTAKTPTTSYVKESVVVAAADLTADEYLDLIVAVTGTAGNVWIDDFSADQ
jgi:hypothetical protein